MVAPALRCSPVRGRQQGVDLWLFEIGNDSLSVFLNGIARICPDHSIWTGLCSPTKLARARMAARRWLRVAMPQ